MHVKRAKPLQIPPQSPDINPIANIFKRVKDILREQAIMRRSNLKHFLEFKKRVIQTLYNFPISEINKSKESVNKRLHLIIAAKGERINY